MTHHSNQVAAYIAGEQAAKAFVTTIQTCFADPDTLFKDIQLLVPVISDAETLGTLRGYCRTLQKEIEGDA